MIVEVLKTTGFRTWGEFLRETTPADRTLIIESIRAHHRERADAMR
jgi:hypothetical protein